MSLECCRTNVNKIMYEIQTKDASLYGFGREFADIATCPKCGYPVVYYEQYKKDGCINYKKTYRGHSAKAFLSKIVFKQKRYKETNVDKRMYLYYNEHGSVKKCYSNLSALKIGLIDPDVGLLRKSII